MRLINPQKMGILWLPIQNIIRIIFPIIKFKHIRPARTLRKRIGVSNRQDLQNIQVNRISLINFHRNKMYFPKNMNKALKMSTKIRKEQIIRSLLNVKQQLQSVRKAQRSQKLQQKKKKKSLLCKNKNRVHS